ncbi:non-contractile tail fiber protein [Klebsiella phage xx20]|uniref:Non-contractile tail fiber protein n=1 Tax=Klebsiella phage P284 TaxID=3229730 RepID=A0AB39C5U5_9CAUD|nr:non-contractile tail fiber protein [Klebsiella phage pKP-M212-2.1]WKV23896.1 non-contractile tail fiber protein [Klebsiella phage xx20]
MPGCVAKGATIAYSWQEQIKPAGTQDIQCDIEYLDKSYIHVYLDGAETTGYTWTSATNIRLNTALAASTTVLLIRKTEREYLYIEFASGSPFIEVNVDSQNTQFLHLAQELVEGRAIPGFYGTISMNGYRITDLANPINAQDAATKAYVDTADTLLGQRIDAEHSGWVSAVHAEAVTRKAADDALSMRTSALENTFISGVETVSYPWSTVLTAATDEVTPGLAFTKAVVEINGVGQIRGYSFEIVDNTILFAEVLPAGTVVAARLGADVTAGDGFATQASVDYLADSLGDLAYLDKAAAVSDATSTGDVVAKLNALLAALRTSGVLAT